MKQSQIRARRSPEVSGQDVRAKKNRVGFQRSRYLSRYFGTSLLALSSSKGHSVLVGVLEWKDFPFINQKEREAERE